MDIIGRSIQITGVVQGVGFRPFVYTLAQRHGLVGWVRNTSAGVDIRAEGDRAALTAFIEALTAEAPPLSHIDTLTAADCPPETFATFEIQHSQAQPGAFQPISPDIAVCAACLRELRDPADRRYRYPFINCTHCGPRFSIITDLPYDRPLTTMAGFPLCAACESDYHNPADRRFHAQPVACPTCGPHVWLEQDDAAHTHDAALRSAAALLRRGQIVAIKGLGGFHLACDATNPAAVAELRRRKQRPAKPFALMMADMAAIRQHCHVSDAEADLLTSPACPIVLLRRRRAAVSIASAVAPGQALLGVMLPYTPLHHLLFDEGVPPLVMTSGNRSDEPIVIDNTIAHERLGGLADAFLLHNRAIHSRTDDSVVRVVENETVLLRRSRGYAPYPIHLPFALPPLLAVGGALKNTFCLTHDTYAFMSHHIGSMDNYATIQAFEQGVAHYAHLFRTQPTLIAHDLHPDYATTRYAQTRAESEGIPAVAVQHHHAHIASVLAENGHKGDQPVIGVCFDGTGYGTDGTIWGGEWLIADYTGFERAAHLSPLRLPGGDAAIRKPARIGFAYMTAAGLVPDAATPCMTALSAAEQHTLAVQMANGFNAPFTSSMGRLFDAVSALAGLCQVATYEGQAAVELEAAADPDETGAYRFDSGARIDPLPVIRAVVDDYASGTPAHTIAGRFHNGVALMIRDVCVLLAEQTGLREIALSGGVFQNGLLLAKTLPLLRAAGFTIYTHRLVPPNDGGLALGQAVVAGRQIKDTG